MSNRSRLGYLAAALTLVFGLLSLLIPYWTVLAFGFDVSRARPWGLSEMRAVFGAMFVMMGGVMLWALPLRPRSAPYLRFAGLLWLAAAAGRLFSLVVDGALVPMNVVFLLLELLIGFGALSASLELPRRGAPERRAPDA